MYFSIEGVIGAGKTTLARLLQKKFKAELQLEVFEENPFLADFYSNRKRYAFQTQIFFLLSRYHQQQQLVPEILDEGNNLITDYTFAKDKLFAGINLQGDELAMYQRVHDALGEKIRIPDLLVYLRADTEVLMQRIAMRDRSYERNMEAAYIESLNKAYDGFFIKAGDEGRQIMTIDSNELDFVKHAAHLQEIEYLIRQAYQATMSKSEVPMEISAKS